MDKGAMTENQNELGEKVETKKRRYRKGKFLQREERQELALKLDRRREEVGWDNINQFAGSGVVPLSGEAVRKVLRGEATTVEVYTLVMICKFLNYQPAEIKEFLQKYTDDKHLWPMLGDRAYNMFEEALHESVNAIIESDPSAQEQIATMLAIMAKGAGVDISKYMPILKGLKAGKPQKQG